MVSVFGRVSVEASDRRLHGWAKKLLQHAHVHLTVSGLEKLDPQRSYLFMSNHQSHYDIPSLFAAWPGSLRMVFKIELARVPVKYLHAPWEAGAATLAAAGVTLGETYPRPIVDHTEAREAALAAFKSLRAGAKAEGG